LTNQPFRFTLLADGASDRSLIPILDWTLAAIPGLASCGTVAQVADLGVIAPAVRSLTDRLRHALTYFPCDVLFVHRGERVQRVAALIEDFSPLRRLAAFAQFEKTVRGTISGLLTGS
jgi:hypothetical protein